MESSINIPLDLIQHFEKIFIDEDTLNSKVSQRVLKFFPAEKIQILSSHQILKDQLPEDLRIKGPLSAEQFSRSKKLLHITQFKGQFFKRCPGASQKRALTCCNYHVLNLGQQCNMNCSYCYLQSYLNTPTMKMYSNIEVVKITENLTENMLALYDEIIKLTSNDGVLYNPRVCVKDISEIESYYDTVMNYVECITSDDITISNYLAMKNIPIVKLHFKHMYRRKLKGDFGKGLRIKESDKDGNAIHLMAGGHSKRYFASLSYLKSQNLL
jgi:hypothetical protein